MNPKVLNVNDYFRSSDLCLVTALSLFFPVEAIDRQPSGKAFLLFRKNNKGFDEVVKKYWARQLTIEPQSFFSQLKNIKARIYSEE